MLRNAEAINLIYFGLAVALSWLFRLPPVRRLQIAALGASGSLLVMAGIGASFILPQEWGWVLRDWLPAPILLIAYWQAGRFFVQPRKGLQATLVQIDRRFGRALERFSPIANSRLFRKYLEIAYLCTYPLVPFGLVVLYLFRYDDFADYFWSVVLPSAYVCYLMLPFAPTLPPRLGSLEGRDMLGDKGDGRGTNLWILDRLGVGANTFPSGHVAASVATGLVVAEFVPRVGAVVLWVALSIAVSVVVRRYHYLLDAVLGIVLAVLVWIVVRSLTA